MFLHIDLDATYLVLPKAKSRITWYYFLLKHLSSNISLTLNKVILIEYKGVKHIVTSSAEAETVAVFHNTQITI